MDAAPASIAPAPSRRTRWPLIAGAVLLGLVLLAGGLFTAWRGFSWFMGRLTGPPWARLHEAAVAMQTDDGARDYFAHQPGLEKRFHAADAFVERARQWRQRLAVVPATAPDVVTLVREGAALNVQAEGGHTTMVLRHYRGLDVDVALDGGRLVDLWVE
jgi:hypothetical protein